MVVLFAEVAEPHILQLLRHILGNGHTTVAIVQMTRTREDAVFEELRIRTALHHFDVVVGLNDQMTRLTDILLHLVGNTTRIGHQTEVRTLSLNEVAHIVETIVRYGKRRHREVAQLQRFSLFYQAYQVCCHLLHHTVVAVDAVVHLAGGIDGNLIVVAEGAYRFDVVGMVVRDEYMLHAGKADTIVTTGFLQASQPDTYINE